MRLASVTPILLSLFFSAPSLASFGPIKTICVKSLWRRPAPVDVRLKKETIYKSMLVGKGNRVVWTTDKKVYLITMRPSHKYLLFEAEVAKNQLFSYLAPETLFLFVDEKNQPFAKNTFAHLHVFKDQVRAITYEGAIYEGTTAPWDKVVKVKKPKLRKKTKKEEDNEPYEPRSHRFRPGSKKSIEDLDTDFDFDFEANSD